MTKAQEVRRRRLDAIQKDITAQAEKVFDWILDLIDANTQKGHFGMVEVCLFEGQDIIKTTNFNGKKGTEYDLGFFLLLHDKLELFEKLKEVVDKEEGFKSVLKPNATLYDSKAIIFQVVID